MSTKREHIERVPGFVPVWLAGTGEAGHWEQIVLIYVTHHLPWMSATNTGSARMRRLGFTRSIQTEFRQSRSCGSHLPHSYLELSCQQNRVDPCLGSIFSDIQE